jgi:sterol 3beta-glucosyltransferase
VQIAIPYSTVLDVEKSSAMDFSETVEIKVVDKEENCVDSYFFAYFHDIRVAVDQIRRAIERAKQHPDLAALETVKDTTSHRRSIGAALTSHETSNLSQSPPSTTTFGAVRDKLTTPVRFLKKPATEPPRPTPTSTVASESGPIVSSSSRMSTSSQPLPDHTYPPPLVHHPVSQASESSAKTTWSVPVGVPNWLKNPSKYFFSSSPETTPTSLPGLQEEEDPITRLHSGDQSDFGFAMIDGLDSSALDPTTIDKFRAAFAFDERETLLAGQYSCAEFSHG